MLLPSVVASALDYLTVSVADHDCVQAIHDNLLQTVQERLQNVPTDSSNIAATYTDYTWFGQAVPVHLTRSGIMLHLVDNVHLQLYVRTTGLAVQVTVYSRCLWSYTFHDIVHELRRFVSSLSGGIVAPLYPVRVDLACDVTNLQLSDVAQPETLDDMLVSRCTLQRTHYDKNAELDETPIAFTRRKRKLESLYIGAPGGAVVWNWYDKRAQALKLKIVDHYSHVWEQTSNFTLDNPLTRFEVRLNAAFLRSFRCPILADRVEVGYLETIIPYLWTYLTLHTRLIIPDTGSGNRSRADTAPVWKLIQSAFVSLSGGKRVRIVSPDIMRLRSQLGGVALSLLAVLRHADFSVEQLSSLLFSCLSDHSSSRGGVRSAVLIRSARLGLSTSLARAS